MIINLAIYNSILLLNDESGFKFKLNGSTSKQRLFWSAFVAERLHRMSHNCTKLIGVRLGAFTACYTPVCSPMFPICFLTNTIK